MLLEPITTIYQVFLIISNFDPIKRPFWALMALFFYCAPIQLTFLERACEIVRFSRQFFFADVKRTDHTKAIENHIKNPF